MEFEWDPRKAKANKAKHGVDFELAKDVFRDHPHSLEQSRRQQRGRGALAHHWPCGWKVSSLSVYTERDGDVIRIISAREASKREEQVYFGHAAP